MNFLTAKWNRAEFGYTLGRYDIHRISSTNWRIEFCQTRLQGKHKSLKDAKLAVQDHWQLSQPIEEIDLKRGIVDAKPMGHRIEITLEHGITVILPKSRISENIQTILNKPRCTCCGEREKSKGYRDDSRVETMLFGEKWCSKCRNESKPGPLPKKKPCKILAKHNRNHKNWLAGNPPKGYVIAYQIKDANGNIVDSN